MKGKQDWSALIAAYGVCGQTQAEFCREHNLVLDTFKGYLKRSRKGSTPSGGFLQLAVDTASPRPSGVELHLPGGFLLRFQGEVCAGYLRDLIAGLRS
jgi:hypothetical protein